MITKLSLILTWAVLGVSILISILLRRKKNMFYLLFGGVFAAGLLIHIPIAVNMVQSETCSIIKTCLMAFFYALRLFVVEGDYGLAVTYMANLNEPLGTIYSVTLALLIVLAPILTFGFVLTFFKTFFSYVNYVFHFFSDTYVFTELNKNSVCLARSLKTNKKRRTIIFTGITKHMEEESDLLEEARAFGAIFFRRSVSAYNFNFHAPGCKVTFFAVGENESVQVEEAIGLCRKYGERAHTELYVFAAEASSEMILSSLTPGKMKLRRINEVQALINRFLYDEGHRVFDTAIHAEGEKNIFAVIVGMNRYGSQIAKSLPWFCQMDGYHLEMHLFDEKESEIERFAVQCPELVDEKHNGNFTMDGEAQYLIRMHEAVEIGGNHFWKSLDAVNNTSFIFIDMQSDERNIQTAVELRAYFEKHERKPLIVTPVSDSGKKEALSRARNYAGQLYEIQMIGDEQELYSEKVMLHSDVEAVALERHLKWGTEEEFWRFEYNYCSSIASAIHRKMKEYCKIPGVEKKKEERTEEERWNLRKLEHRRWNAYMRSKGYTWAEKRNNLAKTHPCLVPFEDLPLEDQAKDDD